MEKTQWRSFANTREHGAEARYQTAEHPGPNRIKITYYGGSQHWGPEVQCHDREIQKKRSVRG